jgi:hypothetical protein
MAIMSVSICTAGGLTQSEPTHHTPKMQKYKLKKEKKERKPLNKKKLVLLSIFVLINYVLPLIAILLGSFYSYLIPYLSTCLSFFFLNRADSGVLLTILLIVSDVVIALLAYMLMIDPQSAPDYILTIRFILVMLVLCLLIYLIIYFILKLRKKETIINYKKS